MADDRLERGAADKQEPALPFRYVVLLGLGYAAALLDRGNVAFAQLEMGQDLGLSAADFGLAAGLFFVPYCLFQVPCVRLMPVLGAHRVLAACLLAWGVASVATSATGSLAELCAARMVLGAFEAGYLPGAVFYLSQCFPAGAVAGPTAALQGLGFVGYALGSLGSGALMQGLGGVAGIRGWRWLFIAQGAPAIIVGAAVLLFLPPPPGTRPGKQMRGVSAFSIAPGRRPATRAPPLLSPRADASPEARLLPDVEAAPLASSHTPAPVSPLGHPPTHPPSPPDEEAAATSSSASQAGEGCASADGGPAAELCAVGARGLTWLFVLNHLSVATLGYMSMFFMPQMVEEMVGDKWSLTQVKGTPASRAGGGQADMKQTAQSARGTRYAGTRSIAEHGPCGSADGRSLTWRPR
jgi:MFS family permease